MSAMHSTAAKSSQSAALIVIFAGVVAALQIGKLPPALPELSASLGMSLMQAGFLLSLVQLADMSLAGFQHFAFHKFKDKTGDRLLAGHSNCSVCFQLAQLKVGEGKVPDSIVLYNHATFLKKGIPILPVYR